VKREQLTGRELQVLREIATTGDRVEMVASRLDMSYQTAKNHLGNAYAALGVRNIVSAFIALGWLVPR
jgi:DNA-binding NarL/FixJ family response regulator